MSRVTCCQLAPDVGDLASNHRRTVEAVRAALASNADIVVLPELATSGYAFESREEAAATAITPDHPLFEDWATAAAARPGAVVIGGFCEKGDDGRLYNSVACVAGEGVLAVYRKTHLWDRERLFFTAGDTIPPVIELESGRIGVCICYELEFPEVTRSLALRGADLIVVPTNWPQVPRPKGENRPLGVLIAMATARVNRVAVACCDRVGTERGQEWSGASSIIDCTGWVQASVATEGTASAEIDIARSREQRLSERNPFTERRAALYGALCDADL